MNANERFLSPSQCGKLGLISTCQIRRMIKAGECPGFYIGAKKQHFLVDCELLKEQLTRMSTENMKKC